MKTSAIAGNNYRGCVYLGWVVALLGTAFALGACGGSNLPDDVVGLVPDDWREISVIDVRTVLEGDVPLDFLDEFEEEWNGRAEEMNLLADDISTSVAAFMPNGSGLRVITGDYIVMEIGNPGALPGMLRGLSRESGLIAYDDDSYVSELMARAGEG